MSTTRREFLTRALYVAGGIALASCAPANPAAPAASPSAVVAVLKRGGKMSIGNSTDPTSLDNLYSYAVSQRGIMRAIHDPLVDYDPNTGKVIPMLAESWDTPDPKTYILHLRKGVKFHDGTDFDAEAVKYHFDRHLDPANKSQRRTELLSVDKVEVVDSSTVKISLKTPYAAFLISLFDRPGLILSPSALKKQGDKYGVSPSGGTGPFKFVEYAQDDHITVERNPNYWDTGKPYLDSITFRVIPVDATRLVELRSGGVQLAEDMPYQDVDRLKQMSEIVLSEKPGFRYEYVRWNAQNSPYGKSLEFRQALNWALDRDAIQKTVYFNTGNIGFAPFLPGQPFYDANYRPFTRDLAKAKDLLEKSGVPKPWKFTMYTTVDPVRQKELQIIQANLAELGVETSIQQEQGAAATARNTNGDYVLTISWWGQRPDPAQYLGTQWHSTSPYYPTGNIKDPETDRLIEQGEQESDVEKRKTIYRQLADRLNAQAEVLFYHNGSNFKGLSPRVKGFVHWPDTLIRYQNLALD